MNRKNRYPIRRVFILDEIAIIGALLIALAIRFPNMLGRWHLISDGFYVTFCLTLCLFNVMVFLLYDNRRKPIFEQDPIENFMTVVKSRSMLLALSLLYLYIVQKSKQSSRAVVGVSFAVCIILSYVLRMLYRRHHLKKYGHLYSHNVLTVHEPYPNEKDFINAITSDNYDGILICGDSSDSEVQGKLVSVAEKVGIRTYCTISSMGYMVRPGIISDISEYASVPAFIRADKFPVFGVNYSIARTEEAVLHVMRHIKELAGQYICFSNVHTSVMARENNEYAKILNGAAFIFPDGSPIAILQRKKGIEGAERVAGPDFMEHMFRNTMDGSISHFFYGSSQETIDALKNNLEKKYPGIVIKGLYSPPFRELTPEEDSADVDMINSSGADIIWIGLGAPKQEKWMQAHKGQINGIMMGVGAGFDFHAGTIKRAPIWIQKTGLEWLYRLFQDPRRLIKRYVITNVKFFLFLMADTISGRQKRADEHRNK
ncbi:WecB/TagA/CpsF family glycosyltransferase [Butyrivibrio sp. FCS014]|uniref:WecB/TagA/CpsF family glycosyltransferase n=1 Tax=Butyrivibrio sp. FCS014 TaxID=1408304 RepID=UPI000463BECD|nr:WecB/TagA/CpsF family glycosyltransferase [Butyrivibrio sp. FCS014]